MRNMFTKDAQQAALGFLVSQTAYIEREVVATVYPDIQYPSLIPVDTSANQWAQSVEYYSSDKVGRAGWFHHNAKDIHVADITRSSNKVGVEMADIGYRYTIQELGVAMMIPGTNLTADKAAAARRAYEEFVDNVALRGNTEKSFHGIMDYPGITTSNVAADGAVTAWPLKSADAIMADVNNALTGMYAQTLQVELADTILLPVDAATLLSSKRVGDTDMTIWDFLAKHNVYTNITGRPLTIRAVRGLESAGVGGVGRMVVYRRDPQVLKMHIPMPHQFLDVWRTAPLVYDVPGIFRIAGLEIRRPGAVRYVDGVLAAEAS
jgi:hypothetical protein